MEENKMIKEGKACLGIEFGSTNIKAVLIGEENQVLASGSHRWSSHVEDGYFSYTLDEIWDGLRDAYRSLKEDVKSRYGLVLERIGCIGISAMMHGYIALDREGKQLAPFQTWRNTNTQAAADALTEEFRFNIPLRWTIAHLYQRMLDQEAHVKKVDFVTTLDSYVHWLLTGEKVTGIGDASGIFPIDSGRLDYDPDMDMANERYDDGGGYESMEKLLSLCKIPHVVIAVNDLTAVGVMRSVSEHGLRIPEDISIISFDDTSIANMVNPRLTSISYNYGIYGAIIMDVADAMIQKKPVREQTLIAPRLVLRKSCKEL